MYAIVRINDKQFQVSKDDEIKVPSLEGKIGKKIELKEVLLLADKKHISIGQPLVKKVKVTGKIIKHDKESKIIVFKKRRRKNSQRKTGHRQGYTQVQITEIKSSE